MFLSRVELDPYKIKTLDQLEKYHGWVENCFPTDLKDPSRPRHLWRIDEIGAKKYLLIVSANQPDLKILERYGVQGTAATKDYQPFLDNLQAGQKYHFRLTANPVYVNDADKRRIAHRTVEGQMKWLQERAERMGVKFLSNTHVTTWGVKPLLRSRKRITLVYASYEGELTIIDVEKAKNILQTGIGRERAYGMGLLTLLPVD